IGFLEGCANIKVKKEAALALADEALRNKIKIGFTGHEPGIGGLTDKRKEIPQENLDIIKDRILAISEGGLESWTRLFHEIINEWKKSYEGTK
ncbi:MAG: hypothetical protein ABH860_01300, partial [bacterium]